MTLNKIKTKHIISILGFAIVLLLFLIPYLYYDDLPDEIPRHFNRKGEVDGMASRNSIWNLSIVGAAFFFLLELTAYFLPVIVQYLDELDAKKNEYLHLGILMLKMFNTLFVSIFLYVNYAKIMTATGRWNGIGDSLSSILFGAIVFLVVFFAYRFVHLDKE